MVFRGVVSPGSMDTADFHTPKCISTRMYVRRKWKARIVVIRHRYITRKPRRCAEFLVHFSSGGPVIGR